MRSTIQYIEKELNGLYPETEIQGFIRLILESVLDLSYTQIILQKEREVKPEEAEKIETIVGRLKKHEPIQYILGKTEFYGLMLNVNPAVLIPRPETEELVHWILNTDLPRAARILDVGTGSGCIPLALKNEIKDAQVTGVDISEKALETARENAILNHLDVTFIHADILNWGKYNWGKYDVIVSNPPYVRESEKKLMQANVLDFEPVGALYVSDNDPLVFYHEIARFAKVNLTKGGWLFYEINEALGMEMKELVQGLGFHSVEVRKDLNGKDRMLACRK